MLPCAELQIGMLWESPDWEAMGKYGDAHVDAEARVNLCTHAHTLTHCIESNSYGGSSQHRGDAEVLRFLRSPHVLPELPEPVLLLCPLVSHFDLCTDQAMHDASATSKTLSKAFGFAYGLDGTLPDGGG